MELIRFRPLAVTFLLLLVYGSGSLFLTTLSFISISIIATFVCFFFKIQIDFERLFSFIEKLWNFEEGAVAAFHREDVNSESTGRGQESERDSSKSVMVTERTLKDLPRPIARKLKLIIDGVMKEFVISWYTQICPEDDKFVDETRRALEQIAVEGYRRICNVDTHSAAVNIINLVTAHLKIFSDCRDAVNSKYPGISTSDFERCVTELYEIRINQHISAKSQGTALDYLRKITDILMFVLVPQSAFSCEGGRFMLREILAIQGLQNLVDLLSDPHFVNKALIDIFEEAIPKEILVQQWKEEACKELISDEETDSDEKLDDKSANEFGNRIESDVYESASEMGGKFSVNNQAKVSHRTKHSSYSSIEHVISDVMESKFVTPRHSTTEWSSADESYNAFDRVLRQNQLEAKSSAPVYGSTMVKLHEKSKHPQVPNVHFQIPINSHDTNTLTTKADSGVYSETNRLRSSSAPLSQVDESVEKRNERNDKNIKVKSKHHKKPKKESFGSNLNNDVQSRVISLTDDNIVEPWSSCPPPESNYYRKISYNEMDKRQDLLSEKLKAKLHAIGSDVKQVSCMKSLIEKGQIRKNRSLPDLKNSFESSMVICQLHGYSVFIENVGSKKKEIIVLKKDEMEVTNEIKEDFVKIHSIPERNAFYDIAPGCPTCIEMTSLASPKQSGKAFLTYEPKQMKVKAPDHECGLSISHFCHPEVEDLDNENEDDDNESFISFTSADSLTDPEDSQSTIASESTLLASVESTGLEESQDVIIEKPTNRRLDNELKSSSVGSFDVLSLRESDSDLFGTNYSEDDLNQHSFDSKDDLDEASLHRGFRHITRAPSITTFASAFDSSTHENSNHHQFSKTPLSSKKTHQAFSNLVKHVKSPLSISLRKGKAPKIPSKILKSFKKLRLKTRITRKDDSSDEDNGGRMKPSTSVKSIQPHKRMMTKRFDLPLDQNVIHDKMLGEIETSYSGTTDSDQPCSAHFPAIPSSVDTAMSQWRTENAGASKHMVEEIADEILEEPGYDENFHDAKSLAEAVSDISDRLTADSLNIERKSNFGEGLSVVHIDNQDENGDDVDSNYVDQLETKDNLKGDWVIPIYDGEVIVPHPGKIPVSAWMYPIQMVSIPNTEVAFEKGWEPGGNKYTLYSIHYDIRIWPEIYRRQMMAASQKPTLEGNPPDGIPIIREIKRRYREFMYLHNRLTHSHLSNCMKGVLRPNRRYAMPFGRMDPDVIEGRRKILETYLVSLVSRPEVCNSREFKEFLGAEGFGSVSVVKQKVMQPKQIVNKVIGNIKSAFPAPKDVTEKGESFQYFIHGYDVPRMFGYAKECALDRNSSPWFSSFVDIQKSREMLPDDEKSSNSTKLNVIGRVEFFQKPKFIGTRAQDLKNENMVNSSFDALLPRSSGAGSEFPELSRDEYFTESPSRRFSMGIPALFTNELAVRSQNETLSTLDARKAAEDIPWPLSDAVMSFLCQGLKGYNCWLTYESVQQALLYSLGGLLEWKISREIDEIFVEERWMKYLNDLYHVVWQDGKLIEPLPEPAEDEKRRTKEEALAKMLDFLPSIVRIIIGSHEYKKWGEELLHALQYKKINKYLLFSAIDSIMSEFIPELQHGFPQYKNASSSSTL